MQRADRHRRGTAALEFALAGPVLILLSLATVDVVQFLRSQLRLDATAVQVGQLVSQCNRFTDPGDINQFWAYAQRILGDVGTLTGADAEGAVIVSAVFSQNGANRVAWQRRTGSASLPSLVGTPGGGATITEGFVVPNGQTLLVTEVALPLQPWVFSASFMSDVLPKVLHGTTLYMTRAPDAPAIQQAPTNNAQPDCTK